MTMKRIIVSAGLIRGAHGAVEAERFLVSRRPAGAHLEHFWEFPGGKVEAGESPPTALVREIREELGIDVSVGDVFAIGHHVYDEREVFLLVYEARVISGEPSCREVAEFKWVTPSELVQMELPPADVPVIERIKRDLL